MQGKPISVDPYYGMVCELVTIKAQFSTVTLNTMVSEREHRAPGTVEVRAMTARSQKYIA